jgi:hypothetical protein
VSFTAGNNTAAGFSTAGNVVVDANSTLTLVDSDVATLGSSTSLEGGTATLIAGNGVSLSAGDVLSGNGTVQAAITLNAGTISPGVSAGDINVTGNVDLTGGTYAAELDGTAAGQFDTLDITGTATLGGAKLDLAGSGHIPAAGESFVILTTTAGITGTFTDAAGNALPEGANVFVNGSALSISYAGGNVTLTFDATPIINAGAGNNDIEVREDAGGNIEVLIGGVIVLDQPLANLTSLTINGQDGDDTLTVDYGGAGGFFNLPITYNGGAGAADSDKLVITGGAFATATHTFTLTGPEHSGDIVYDTGLISATISYTGLEPVDMTGSTITDLVFNLPDAVDTVFLEDDGTAANTISRLRSGGDLFDPTTFANTATSVTVNMGATAAVAMNVNVPDFTKTLVLNGLGGADTVTFAGAVNLTSAGASLTVDVGGAISDAAATSLQVNDLASFTGSSITLGDNAADTTNFGSLASDGDVTSISEDSTSNIDLLTATTLSLTSAGAIVDNNGAANNIDAATATLVAAGGVGDADAL